MYGFLTGKEIPFCSFPLWKIIKNWKRLCATIGQEHCWQQNASDRFIKKERKRYVAKIGSAYKNIEILISCLFVVTDSLDCSLTLFYLCSYRHYHSYCSTPPTVVIINNLESLSVTHCYHEYITTMVVSINQVQRLGRQDLAPVYQYQQCWHGYTLTSNATPLLVLLL